jgi:hypothetical protein
LPCANRSAASTIAPTSTMATRSAPLAPRSSFSALHVCHQPSLAVPPSTAPTGEDARHHPMAARPRLSTTVAGAGMPMEDELVVASPSWSCHGWRGQMRRIQGCKAGRSGSNAEDRPPCVVLNFVNRRAQL